MTVHADTEPGAGRVSDGERRRRWRLVLGAAGDSGEGESIAAGFTAAALAGADARMDAAMAAVYDAAPRRGRERAGGLGSSAPSVARWLGDIRRYFPTSVVQVMQRDAIERLDLQQLILEPELLSALEPDIHLASLLVELNQLLPDETRATARAIVRSIVEQLERRFGSRTRDAVDGALASAQRTHRPRPADIDWLRTIEANLRHYLPEQRTVVPERLVGRTRRRRGLQREVIVAIDQSASMSDSVVYASMFAAVLGSMSSLRTSVVAFDTAVADLTPLLHDPVDLVFGVQLGGGTDIATAMAYCRQLVSSPADTVVVLVSDLFEGGSPTLLVERMAEFVRAGATVVVLLALSDSGAPAFDHAMAASLAEVGVVSLACTPDAFPDLFAAAVEGRDVARWANEHGLHTAVAPTAPSHGIR
jgi:Mg-chelatase subunit ChlD